MNLVSNANNSIDLVKSTHELLAPGIIRLVLKPNFNIEPSDLKEMHQAHLKLSNHSPFGILLITTEFAMPSPESRALLASEEFIKTHKASAYITKSISSKIIGNFFIQFNKPITPTKLFNKEEFGLIWLKKEMEKWI